MMRCICPEDKCTACEACVVVCPKKCIQRQFNEDRSWKLVIEEQIFPYICSLHQEA